MSDSNALSFHNTLRKCVARLWTKLISFSAPISRLSDEYKHLAITRQEVYDVTKSHLLWHTLSGSAYFAHLNMFTREQLVENLATKIKSSFLWAFHFGRILAGEASPGALTLLGSQLTLISPLCCELWSKVVNAEE